MSTNDRAKPLVLVVDDDNNFREILGTKLRESGFDVELAKDANEAIQKAGTLLPNLILMDIQMPGELNGIDASFRIKEDPATAGIKIAFLSNAANPWPMVSGEKAEVSREFGMEDFIPKSEDPDIVLGKVRGLLSVEPMPAPPPTPPPPPSTS